MLNSCVGGFILKTVNPEYVCDCVSSIFIVNSSINNFLYHTASKQILSKVQYDT